MARATVVALAAAALAVAALAHAEPYDDPDLNDFDDLDDDTHDSGQADSQGGTSVPSVPSWVSLGKQKDEQTGEHETNRRVVEAANRAGTTFDLVMYGDSITAYHMKDPAVWRKYFDPRKATPLAMGGSNVAELAARIIQRGENLANDPRNIVLLIGINDIKPWKYTDPAPRLDFLVQWLQAAHPTSRIFVMALIPNAERDVRSVNAKYRALAEKRGAQFLECTGLDLNKHYKDSTHPNAAGQDILMRCIKAATGL